MIYDYVIIGGGLAGVYCAYKLSSRYKILLIEKESQLGGRGLMINCTEQISNSVQELDHLKIQL